MNRTERRAAEHQARKAAYKAARETALQQPNTTEQNPPAAQAVPAAPLYPVALATPKPEISEARLAANRANAQFSTGAKTEEGRAKCAQNAVKTALTGRTVILPTDDIAAYQDLGRLFIEQHQPATPEEERLVQCLIDAEWRLMRIPTLESGLFALGRRELADSVPADLLEIEIYLKYERTLKNLHIQEARIRRNREKDVKALRELQAARHEAEATARKIEQLTAELRRQPPPAPELTPTAPVEAQPVGFEISTPEMEPETALRQAA